MRLTIDYVAKKLGYNNQAVRELAKQGKLPFIEVKESKQRDTYYINSDRFELYRRGKL